MSYQVYTILQVEPHATSPAPYESEVLERSSAQLVTLDGPADERFDRTLASCDAILCAAVEITRELMSRAPGLRIVARFGTGVDNIDTEAATDLGVVVTNVPDFATGDVAEHAIALILACARNLMLLDKSTRSGDWDIRSRIRSRTVDGSTLGLIGFGRIGRAVAKYATGLGMRVIAYDPFVGPEDMLLLDGTEPADIEELLARADFVSLHAPLMRSTRHMISTRELALMKPTAYLINCSRGPLVDEAALVEAIESGTIAGAALDVFEEEPPPLDSAVLSCEGIMVTPHCAAHTESALVNLRKNAIACVLQALAGEWPDNVVNPEVREKWLRRLTGRNVQ
ncbi:MAG: hypothetical protein A2Z18_08565 [Armatimonadetes bacterium RBG_16_58_9]|nr:MAG: hypothetical protein A2Z18_08565 [Armatimonadetes bacterium RBG_16_58_9]